MCHRTNQDKAVLHGNLAKVDPKKNIKNNDLLTEMEQSAKEKKESSSSKEQ